MEKSNMRLWIFALVVMLFYTLLMFPIQLVHIQPYYSVLFLVNLGLVCWVTNLFFLDNNGIQVEALFRVKNESVEIRNIYSILVYLFSLTIASFYLYKRAEMFYDEELAEWIPFFTYILIGAVLFYPADVFYPKERFAFHRSLKRIVFGGLYSSVPFCDVIFADILTSFSRVFGDLEFALGDLLLPRHIHERLRFSWLAWVAPVIVGLPYCFRFRQCISEYVNCPKSEKARHLANAIKYLSAFPVIFSSAYFHYLRKWNIDTEIEAESTLIWTVTLWTFFSCINSLYSLYWDVFVDWELFSSKSSSILGRPLHFKNALLYIFAILFNIGVRLFWMIKVAKLYSMAEVMQTDASTHVIWYDFVFKILEIIRRWVWVFFRVEREWVMVHDDKMEMVDLL